MADNKANKILKIVLIVFLAIILVMAAVVGVIGFRLYRSLDVKEEETVSHAQAEQVTDPEEDEEEEVILSQNELRSADDLSTALREWSENTDEWATVHGITVGHVLVTKPEP